MISGADDTPAIDLSVAFFCSVLVLFVFVSFSLDHPQAPFVPATLGQIEETQEVSPPTWSAINKRGSIALFSKSRLVILDLVTIAEGILDMTAAFDDGLNYMSFIPSHSASPNTYKLTLSLVPGQLPKPWVRKALELDAEAPCFEENFKHLTVLIDRQSGTLNDLTAFAQRCGVKLRPIYLRAANDSDGSTQQLIKLLPGDFKAESMFR